MTDLAYGHDETEDYETLAEAERQEDGSVIFRVVTLDKTKLEDNSMTDYTPTTEEIRASVIVSPWDDSDRKGEEFDRWLEEHDREVAERAWSAALKHVAALSDPAYTMNIPRDRELITLFDVSQAMYENPYRKETT